MTTDPTKLPPQVEKHWAKCWLDQQKDLFKVRQKPIAAIQKNVYNPELLMGYFEEYKMVVDKFGILLAD